MTWLGSEISRFSLNIFLELFAANLINLGGIISTPVDFSVLNSLSIFLTSCSDIVNKEQAEFEGGRGGVRGNVIFYVLHWDDLHKGNCNSTILMLSVK